MLQIRLSKPASGTGAPAKPVPVDSVTVACPDHLVLADLPVVTGLGSASATALIKSVGRRSRRQLGERVHFCVRCDFPIAIYGRLSPCKHAFCLDCARSDSLCYLCDERIQKIQTIKMMEGIFICAAPHCFKSFLKKSEFESHINEAHADLHPNKEKEGNESEVMSARKPSVSDSTVQASPRPIFSPHSSSQARDHEDKTQNPQLRDQPSSRPALQPKSMPSFSGQAPNHQPEQNPDGNQSHDRATSRNCYPQPTIEPQGYGGLQQNSVPAPPQFCYPHPSDGTQQFFGVPYETARTDSTPETGLGQGSLLGFPPGPAGPMNFVQNYAQPWNIVPGSVPLEPPMLPQGTYGKGILAPQQIPLRPPTIPPHLSHAQGRSYSGEGNHDGPSGFSWPTERHNFGGPKD